MNKLNILFVAFVFAFGACTSTNSKEKYQNSRSNVIDVSAKIKKIDLGDVFLGSLSIPLATNEYLIMGDCKSVDSIVHVFDINTFKHVGSLARFGEGPLEIASFSNIWWNEWNRNLYVNDGGQFKILIYNLDSALADKNYIPKSQSLNPLIAPTYNWFINDSMSLANVMALDSSSVDYNFYVGLLNMNTFNIDLKKYMHPNLDKKRISIAVSLKDSLYAECEVRYDLVSIFNFKGDLLYNVYGENWGKTHTNNFFNACFTKDYLIAGYDGTIYEQHNPITKCQVFTKQGDYVCTLDLGCEMLRFCYDELHNRLIFCLNHTFQYGYINLDEIKINKKY